MVTNYSKLWMSFCQMINDDKIFDDGIICSKEDEKEFDDYVNYLISDGKWYIGAEGINQLMTDANTISPN